MYHLLVAEVCDQAVGVVMLTLIEWVEISEVIPVTVSLISNMITHSTRKKNHQKVHVL